MPGTFDHGYALLVGVGQCSYMPWSLPTTVLDSKAIREILVDTGLCGYDPQHIRLLNDAEAKRETILDGLGWLKQQASGDAEAMVVVYFSGHGWVDEAAQKYYLITNDVDALDVPNTALTAEAFASGLRDISARRLLTIIDACHAEGVAKAKDGAAKPVKLPPGFDKSAPPPSLVEALRQGEGRAVFSSSRGKQRSYIRKDEKLSIFTYHLIEALQGANNKTGDTQVKLSNLMNHLSTAVPESAQKEYHTEQVPFFDMAAEDYPVSVAVLRGGKGLPPGGWAAVQEQAHDKVSQIVQAIGERSVAIGGDAKNSVIITGNGNKVQRGKYNINIDKANGLAIGDNARVDAPDDE